MMPASGAATVLPQVGPALSVIISCHNYEAYVGEAIASVTSQRRDDVELIVIDDGSADRSWQVITALRDEQAAAGRPFTAHRMPNAGQRAACLFGFQQSQAPFILFLDADDALLPGSIDALLRHLDPAVAKLQFPLARIDGAGRPIGGPRPALRDAREREALKRQVLRTGVYTSPPTSGNVFRRDLCALLEEADYDAAVDGVILFAAPFFGDVVSLSTPLGLYRLHDRNDSGLNRMPEAAALARDLSRFAGRMAHLRQVIARKGVMQPLVRTEDAFFHLERSLYLAISAGKRPPARLVARLMGRLWGEPHGVGARLAMTAFFALSALLPPARARRALAWRFGVGQRSPAGLVRAVAGA